MTHKLNPVAFEAAHKTYLDDGAGYVAVKLANAINAYLAALPPVAFLRHRKATNLPVIGQPGQTEDEVWTGSYPAYDLRRSVYDPVYNAEREAAEAAMPAEPAELHTFNVGDRVRGKVGGTVGTVRAVFVFTDPDGYIPKAEVEWEGSCKTNLIRFDRLESYSASRHSNPQRLADAIEKCDWSGCAIGNKVILQDAVVCLRNADKDVDLFKAEHRKAYAEKWYRIGAADITENFERTWEYQKSLVTK